MKALAAIGLSVGVLLLVAAAPASEGPKGPKPGQMEGKRSGPGGMRARGGEKDGKGDAPRGRGGRAGRGEGGEPKRPGTAPGNMFLKQGGTKVAAASFRKQLEKNPDSVAAHVGLGKALARMGKCEEALEHLSPYVGTLPFGGDAALAASTCSGRLGLLADAIYYDRIAVDLNPESARALTNLALDLASAGDHVGTDETLEDLLFLRKDRDASAYARAVLALRAGDLETFDIVVATWERNDGAGLDLRRLQAQSWLDMDDPLAAEDALRNVSRLRNGNQVRHLRAEAERRLGYPSEATSHLADRPQSVLEGADSDAVRARVYTDEGDYAKAHEVLAGYEGLPDAEILASAWYLAAREGRAAELPGLQAAYEEARVSPLRELSHLYPWPLRER